MTQTALLRRRLLAVLAVGIIGTAAELLLTSHTEEFWQWLPIALLALGLPPVLAAARRPRAWLVMVLRGIMVLFMVAGLLGLWFHYASNAEFAAELSPDLAGFALLADAMTRQTPPPLAPGTMILLGMLGLVACHGMRGEAPAPFRSQGD